MRKIIDELKKIKHSSSVLADKFRFFISLSAWNKNNIYLLGTPTHSNIGDNAIAYAEIEFLKDCGISSKNIIEVTEDEYVKYEDIVNCTLSFFKNSICLHGGGNMGNLWLGEELMRRRMLCAFQNNPIVIFPQSFYYTDDDNGRKELATSTSIYNNCKSLTIFARETPSYKKLLSAYGNAKIIQVPDIVLSLSFDKLGLKPKERAGVLLVMREDCEKAVDNCIIENIINRLSIKSMKIAETDMVDGGTIHKENRFSEIMKKIEIFQSSELVITDRLHAMIFSAITKTPCIVLANNNHKIQGTYEYLKDLDFISFLTDIGNIDEEINRLLSIDNIGSSTEAIRKMYNPLIDEISKLKRGHRNAK